MTEMQKHEPTAAQNALVKEFQDTLNRHRTNLSSLEILAIVSQMTGAVSVLQTSSLTVKEVMDVITANIAAGQATAAKFNSRGSA